MQRGCATLRRGNRSRPHLRPGRHCHSFYNVTDCHWLSFLRDVHSHLAAIGLSLSVRMTVSPVARPHLQDPLRVDRQVALVLRERVRHHLGLDRIAASHQTAPQRYTRFAKILFGASISVAAPRGEDRARPRPMASDTMRLDLSGSKKIGPSGIFSQNIWSGTR